MEQPGLEFAFRISVDLTAGIQEVGDTGKGIRKVVSITGGTIEGPNIKGKVVAGGYDWQLLRADGVVEIDARYLLQTDDGDLITITNTGLRHGPPEVMARLVAGEDVDPAEYYFRTVPEFIAPNGPYEWLNKSIFVCAGARYASGIRMWVWRVT